MDLGLLILRATVGSLLAGHGAQKLFGLFGGYGLKGTGAWLESLGLTPGRRWAALAGASEFGGGTLTALGFLTPLGAVGSMGAMAMATIKVHSGKPVWVTEGGPELPLTNMAVQAALVLAGPGRYSLDRALGIRLPVWIILAAIAATTAGVVVGVRSSAPVSDAQQDAAHDALQSEGAGADGASGQQELVGVPIEPDTVAAASI